MTPEQALQALATDSQERGEYDMTERERFDKWASDKIWDIYYDDEDPSRYENEYVQSAWDIWQAARAQPPAFCPRCGKRNSADLIHTCTPPGE